MTVESPIAPKSLSASEYVLALFEPTDTVAVLTRNRRTGQTVQRITSAKTVAGEEFQSWLRRENSAGADIFIGMNPLKDGSYSRTKDNVREVRHVYLDLDTGGQDALEAIRNSLEVPAPNFVLDTSRDKHQVVWKVEGLDQEQAESMLRAIVDQFGGDPAATDSTRVLRLPGFANRKYNEEFTVQARQESTQIYQARDFMIQENSPEAARQRGIEPGRRIPQGHRSQSEQDWAYAKRALARGDDVEEVIRRIADYRADDKPDPQYYARHTVTRAQTALQHTTAIEGTPYGHIEPASEQEHKH